MSKSCTILGIKINTESLDEVLQEVHRFIDTKKPHQITTVNTEFVIAARQNPGFAKTINESDLSLADGAGIILAAKLLKQPKPPKISGVDFTPILAKEAARQNWSIFLLGGQGRVAEFAANKLKEQNPGLKIAGILETDPQNTPISQIRKAHPDILFVAWGAPKQDLWINQHKNELNIPVMMGVGGTFDFIVGKQKRAPKMIRNVGLEWLWRLTLEPWRWKRQLALPKMFLLIFWLKLTGGLTK